MSNNIERVDKAKRANLRENKRLEGKINGHISTELKFHLGQMEHKRNLARKELAANELERRKNQGRSTSNKLSKTDDPTEVLKVEIDKEKQIQNKKMLEKSKKKNMRVNGLVKNFMDKLSASKNAKLTEKENLEKEVGESSQKTTKCEQNINQKVKSLSAPSTSSTPFDVAYEEAKKARYVRTKEPRDFEIELSTEDVFSD